MSLDKLFIENEYLIRRNLRTLNLRKVDIDDIVQDTFLKMRRSKENGVYEDNGKFSAWICIMAKRIALDRMRKDQRGRVNYKMIELDSNVFDNSSITYHEMIGKDPQIEEVNNKFLETDHEQWLSFRKVYKNLKPRFKETMDLHMYSRMQFKEIAKIHNCSIMTSLGRWRYGKLALEKELKNGYNEIKINQHNESAERLQ